MSFAGRQLYNAVAWKAEGLQAGRALGPQRRATHSRLLFFTRAKVAKLVDALDLGSSRVTCESSSLSFRTNFLTGL